MNRFTHHAGRTRFVVVAAALAVFAGAGAAAATGVAPWSQPDTPTQTEPTQTEPTVTEPTVTEPTVTQPATTQPADPDPTASEPPSRESPSTEQPTEPASTEPPSTEPPSTEPTSTTRHEDTHVPEGISLTCTLEGSTVTCSWSGGVVPGFAKFLLLRGDGSPRGRVPYMTSDPSATSYIDAGLAPGSYSYVVVSVDTGSTALVHSNPVFVQVVAPD